MLYAYRVIRVDDDTSYPYPGLESLVSLQAARIIHSAESALELVASSAPRTRGFVA